MIQWKILKIALIRPGKKIPLPAAPRPAIYKYMAVVQVVHKPTQHQTKLTANQVKSYPVQVIQHPSCPQQKKRVMIQVYLDDSKKIKQTDRKRWRSEKQNSTRDSIKSVEKAYISL